MSTRLISRLKPTQALAANSVSFPQEAAAQPLAPLRKRLTACCLPLLVGLVTLLNTQPSAAQTRPPIPTVFDTAYTKRPARMVYFVAWEYQGGGQIEWLTTKEGKIKEFEVQRSSDAHTWEVRGTMNPLSGAEAPKMYTFYERNLRQEGAPVLYYRVRLVAEHGRSTYSPTRAIHVHDPMLPWRTSVSPPVGGVQAAPVKQ